MAIRSVPPTVSSSQFDTAIAQFKELVAIPSVTDSDSKLLEAAAEFCRKSLSQIGFGARLVRIENSAPFVVARRTLQRDYPTIFLYSHYDTPPAKENPCVLTERDGRLYGPGACGKGGIITILTALGVTESKPLPLNIAVIFNGENGNPSENLYRLLMQEVGDPISKAAVIFEGTNLNAETGSLLYSTRGKVTVKLTVAAANKPVPSNDAALLPDPAMHLSKWVATLDPPASIPHFLDRRFHPQKPEIEQLKMSSPTFQQYATTVGMLPQVIHRSDNFSVYGTIAKEPWIQILKMNTGESSSTMAPSYARATVEIRTLSLQFPEDIVIAVKSHLEQMPNPHSFQRTIRTEVAGKGWQGYFDNRFVMAYQNALHSQFPKVGVIAHHSPIPCTQSFETAGFDLVTIIPGLADPLSTPSEPVESIDKNLLRNAIGSLVVFLRKAADITPYPVLKKSNGATK
jgi:acetylornithine deacetylase/succinyl-diaminopimelate desuccinylase-like protein